MTGAERLRGCPRWCVTDHGDDRHGEHPHRGEVYVFSRGGELVEVALQSRTTDDYDDDGPWARIGDGDELVDARHLCAALIDLLSR